MIEKIIEYSIKNKFLVILMTLFIIAAGFTLYCGHPWMPSPISPTFRSSSSPNTRAKRRKWWRTRSPIP